MFLLLLLAVGLLVWQLWGKFGYCLCVCFCLFAEEIRSTLSSRKDSTVLAQPSGCGYSLRLPAQSPTSRHSALQQELHSVDDCLQWRRAILSLGAVAPPKTKIRGPGPPQNRRSGAGS